MALALNNLKRVDMPLNKETKQALKIGWMLQYDGSKTTLKGAKKDLIQQPITTLIIKGEKEQRKLGKKKWEEKQMYGYFKRQTIEISHEKTWTWLQKGNLKIETEFLLIAV